MFLLPSLGAQAGCLRSQVLLPLPLFVLWIGADHAHDAAAVNHLALGADLFDRCSDLHKFLYL